MRDKFDINRALLELGWSRAELSRKLGIHKNTVSKWGNDNVPEYAIAYMELALKVRRFAKDTLN